MEGSEKGSYKKGSLKKGPYKKDSYKKDSHKKDIYISGTSDTDLYDTDLHDKSLDKNLYESDLHDLSLQELRAKLKTPNEDAKGFSVRSLVTTLISRLRLILLLFLIFAAASIGAAYFYIDMTRTHTGLASAIIMFSFPEAEEGLDPQGNPLNANEIRSPYVIGLALDSLGLRERGISAENVRAGMVVSGVIDHDILHRIMLIQDVATRSAERLMDLEEVFFHPTMYVLRLYRNGGLEELSDQEMVDLLNEIIYQYIGFFAITYSDFRFLDVIVGHFDPDEYDYFEIVQILRRTIDNMVSYALSMYTQAPDFRAHSTQMTFGDILANLELLRNVDIHRISALVHSNSMSRNRQRSASILEYQIIRLEMELDVAQANADDALYLAYEIYEHVQWVLPYMEQYYIFHRETDVYEYFLRNTFDYRRTVNQLVSDIEFYRTRMDALRMVYAPADPVDVQFVEDSIPTLFDSLYNWENIINKTAEDFLTLELYQDAVRLLTPAGFTNSLQAYRQQMALIVLVGSSFGLFLGAMIALYKGER